MPAKMLLSLLTNSDDVQLFWRPADNAPIPNCLGFAIERETTTGPIKTRAYLDNRTGFADKPGQPGEHQPSNVWPFQRFSWTDHEVNTGSTVAYRVLPVMPNGPTKLMVDMTRASDWTATVTLGPDMGNGTEMFFNRGLVMSQFMSRHLAELQKTHNFTFNQALSFFKKQEIKTGHSTIREFLGGDLKKAAVQLFADAKAANGHVYGALFELADPEIIAGLKALKGRAHIVLADGAQGNKAKPWEDENADARKALKAAGVEVFDRLTRKRTNSPNSGTALAHNKFLVVTDAAGTPLTVWTGSTNLTPTGFCTQINNAVRITHAGCAGEYFQQWKRLRDAQNSYPPTLVTSNSSKHPVAALNADIWFTRTGNEEDLAALRSMVNQAKQGVLFLMFMPGGNGLYKTVADLAQAKPNLLVHGVVSTLPSATTGKTAVTLHGATSSAKDRKPYNLDIVQPEGINQGFASWLSVVARNIFTSQIGHAIVHSKLVVIDPLTNPVVITGSHNFSGAASTTNDENFVVIRGNSQLARAYSAHICSVYAHYRWLKYVNQTQASGESPWSGLARDDKWQKGRLAAANLKELKFWVP